MPRFNVYGVSDWPENLGERFEIFKNHSFESAEAAAQWARLAYKPNLEVIVEEVK